MDQENVHLAVHANDHLEKVEEIPFEIIPTEAEPPSLLELDASSVRICEDVEPGHTGFEAHDDGGYLHKASCADLAQYCHNETIGEQVRVSCPVSCFICQPGHSRNGTYNGPCFDALETGIRFREGPKAKCPDLINYCNQSSIKAQVQEACKLSCGICELHIEGPYMDAYGNCFDLQTHEEPQFTVNGQLAGCLDMEEFCHHHPDSYLIRHKCPKTCSICGNAPPTTKKPEEKEERNPNDAGHGCDRRRRWGFCSSRRRRLV